MPTALTEVAGSRFTRLFVSSGWGGTDQPVVDFLATVAGIGPDKDASCAGDVLLLVAGWCDAQDLVERDAGAGRRDVRAALRQSSWVSVWGSVQPSSDDLRILR